MIVYGERPSTLADAWVEVPPDEAAAIERYIGQPSTPESASGGSSPVSPPIDGAACVHRRSNVSRAIIVARDEQPELSQPSRLTSATRSASSSARDRDGRLATG
jgi:hypothetical protein